jgi:hypothetical protein
VVHVALRSLEWAISGAVLITISFKSGLWVRDGWFTRRPRRPMSWAFSLRYGAMSAPMIWVVLFFWGPQH